MTALRMETSLGTRDGLKTGLVMESVVEWQTALRLGILDLQTKKIVKRGGTRQRNLLTAYATALDDQIFFHEMIGNLSISNHVKSFSPSLSRPFDDNSVKSKCFVLGQQILRLQAVSRTENL